MAVGFPAFNAVHSGSYFSRRWNCNCWFGHRILKQKTASPLVAFKTSNWLSTYTSSTITYIVTKSYFHSWRHLWAGFIWLWLTVLFQRKNKCKVTHERNKSMSFSWVWSRWTLLHITGTGLYYNINHTFCAAFMQAFLQLTLKDRPQSWMKTNAKGHLCLDWQSDGDAGYPALQHTLCVPTYLWHMESCSSSVYCSTGIVTIMQSTRSCSISEWQTLLNNNPFHLQA